ncbi:4Fe-4S binding protein [Methanocorpusculum labreanum]|nr:4Fe-4S binding protein [Methanocorpusculum labreanum]
MVMEQRLLKSVSQLILDTSRCVGCGICLDSCPKDAIVLQNAGVLKGEGAISVDPVKCSYCGICAILCPLRAVKVTVNGEKTLAILDNEGFPQYDFTTSIDEKKCKRCTVCSEVCPEGAIIRDIPIYEGQDPAGAQRHTALTADITMVICLHKCTVCGVCASLCPALSVERDPFTAEKMCFGPIGCPAEKSGIKCNSQSGQIKWEKSLCDACGVCMAACPEEAILEVTRKLKKDPILPGKVTINKENCVTCSWCEKTCPYDAVEVTKFFEGELVIDAEKCPEGCSTCVEICPCHAIFMAAPAGTKGGKKAKKGKKLQLSINQDLCILCGACVNACHGENALTLHRTHINVKGTETDMFKDIAKRLCEKKISSGIDNTADISDVKE